MKSDDQKRILSDSQSSNNTYKKEKLTLRYNLFDLPTAQHKAGLAGLLVMIESLKRRGMGPLPEVSELGASSVTITIDRESMQVLFDDFFAAETVEVKKNSKIEIRPKASFLTTMGMPKRWQELWKYVIVKVLRAGAPAALTPFRDRLTPAKKSKSMEWKKLWKSLKKNNIGRLSKSEITMSSSDMIGVEEVNAEMVPYEKMPEDAFLLYFWPVTTLPFVTQKLERPKNGKTSDYLFSYNNYALVVPEVFSLDEFVEDIFELYPQCLDDTVIGKAPRPTQSVITTPKEAALIFAAQRYEGEIDIFPVPDSVSSLDVIHLKYGQGSPKVIENSTIVPDTRILSRYHRIATAYYNPFFKAQIINNMLNGVRWFENVFSLFSHYPKEFFVFSAESPKKIFGYYRDCQKKFYSLKSVEEEEMKTEEGRDDLLASRIYDLVRHYIRIKSEMKSGKKVKDFQKNEQGKRVYPEGYREAVEKVSMDAFLAMRGRREQDFVEYFTGTICSVPQFLPEKDYLLVSQSLIDEWEKAKALSMLAISANSWLPGLTNNKNGDES